MPLAFLGTHITFAQCNEPSKLMRVFCLRSVPVLPMLVLTYTISMRVGRS